MLCKSVCSVVFCFVFMCLALSVFATIEEHEEEAGEMLYYLEIVIVVWFGIEFFIRNGALNINFHLLPLCKNLINNQTLTRL